MLILSPLLFTGLSIGAAALVVRMLRQVCTPQHLERYRLLFVFGWCLSLACLVPLWLADMLTRSVWGTHAAAVGMNVAGWALTFAVGRPSRAASGTQCDGPDTGIRTYTVYYEGKPLGLVTKGAFDKLNELGLLKKQQTVELVEEYQRRAREAGAAVQLFRSQDGAQTLIKVVLDQDRA